MFQLSFEDDNAAFEDGDPEEYARILKHVADEVRGGSLGGPILDVNGNRVGEWSMG